MKFHHGPSFTLVIRFIPGTFHFLTEPGMFCCGNNDDDDNNDDETFAKIVKIDSNNSIRQKTRTRKPRYKSRRRILIPGNLTKQQLETIEVHT